MNTEIKPVFPLAKAPSLPKLTKLSSISKPKLIIPLEVERKIRQICNKIHEVEWSGTLFYRYKNAWENLEVECVDIYLMDIGSAAYTEFDVEPGVIAYMCDHPELMDCQMGLIHSHNNMATFFSGTDTNTLQSEGNKRNHFVSLIVNNAGTYTAGITRKVDIRRTIMDKRSFRSYEDTLWNICADEKKVEAFSEIEWVEFDIEKASVSNDCVELDERIAEIRQRKAARSVKVAGAESFLPEKKWASLRLFDDDLDTLEPVAEKEKNPSLLEHGDKALDKIIHSYFLQLVTGAVTIADESKININRWADSMERLFDRRFGGTENYKVWAEGFCEFLVMYPAPKYEDVDEFEYASYVAYGLLEELEGLKENKYINTLISILAQWTVE